MEKRTLEQAFNAVFHDKGVFEEFLSLDIGSEKESFIIDGREVVRQSKKLKKYLRFVDRVILRYLAKDDDVVHSFVKDKNTLTAVQAHSDSKYFFITDICGFYSNIRDDDVRRILMRDKDLIPISDFKYYIDFIVSITTYKKVVPVGLSTSPQLSNAFLYEFDCAVKELCDKRSLIYTRYADDIIISGRTLESVSDLSSNIQEMLIDFGGASLKLKDSKTHITWVGNKVKILGLVLLPNGRVTIDSKHKRKIESILYFYTNDKEKYRDFLERNMHGSEKSLFGLLHYANSIDPSYLEKLQRKYGAFALRSLMEEKEDDS